MKVVARLAIAICGLLLAGLLMSACSGQESSARPVVSVETEIRTVTETSRVTVTETPWRSQPLSTTSSEVRDSTSPSRAEEAPTSTTQRRDGIWMYPSAEPETLVRVTDVKGRLSMACAESLNSVEIRLGARVEYRGLVIGFEKAPLSVVFGKKGVNLAALIVHSTEGDAAVAIPRQQADRYLLGSRDYDGDVVGITLCAGDVYGK